MSQFIHSFYSCGFLYKPIALTSISMNSFFAPFAKPLYVMLKPIGAMCNLQCEYCYYLEKSDLYADYKKTLMSDDLLEKFVEQYINSQTMSHVLFTWHGGETLMRNIDFYKKALRLQKKYAGGRQVDNSIQTNGTLLTDEWCSFFKENNFLVGISIDGPRDCHDVYRKGKNGEPSFDDVLRGINLLKKHDVEFNIMGVVNDYNVDYPLEFYRFFKELDVHYIQFAPVVETLNGEPTSWSVDSEKWGCFLIAVFDEWVRRDVGVFYIQYFDAVLANWMGVAPSICTLSKTCGHAGVMEFNGDVYSCDHFVYPEYKLGNIYSQTLTEMMCSQRQLNFGINKHASLPLQCKECRYFFTCYGECPKNRIMDTVTGESGLNYLCKGFYKFFQHIEPYMSFMKNELQAGRAPANIMQALVNGTL